MLRPRCVISYYALFPDPLALHIDAFATTWDQKSLYLNPTFALAQRVVDKLLAEPPPFAVLLLPDWPAQIWYQQLSAVATRSTLVDADAVEHGPNRNLAEPLINPRWRLRAWLLRRPL